MNTVLVQEVEKYNKLITLVKKGLKLVKMGLEGLLVMNEELEKIA